MTERHGFHRLTVEQVVAETADTSSFVLDVPDDLAATFRYSPGQFCTVRVRIGDDEHLRSYSMSSAPETDDRLTLTVKRVPGGVVSNWLLDHVAAGDTLEMTRPAGVFCPRQGAAPVVAFCGGSGVTPVMSIARSVLAGGHRQVRMLYANRDAASVIFEDALAGLATAHPDRFELHHHLDDGAGYLDAARVAAFLGADRDVDVYICGPTPFMDLVESTLLGAGVSPERIVIERFVNAHEIPEAVPNDATGEEGTQSIITVILKGKRHEIAHQPGDTILNTTRRGGLSAPFSCEAGNCATCMALVADGAATMRTNNALEDDEVEEGWVLTCQAEPTTASLTVDYDA